MDINSTWTLRVCQIWIPSGNRPRPACRVLPFLYRSLATHRPRLWRREIGRYAPLRDWQRLWVWLLLWFQAAEHSVPPGRRMVGCELGQPSLWHFIELHHLEHHAANKYFAARIVFAGLRLFSYPQCLNLRIKLLALRFQRF